MARRFRYLGRYQVTRVDPLSVDEWAKLSAEVSAVIFISFVILRFFLKFKSVYAKLTKDKTKDTRTLEDILIAYDNGNLRVPCVQVQCIGFDEDFFSALLAEKDARQSTVP